jgi:cell division protein FtsN
LFGFLAGMVTGLALAAGAAIYLTGAPLPFVNRVQPSTEKVTPEAADPNRPLFSLHIPTAPRAPSGGTAAEGAPPPPGGGGAVAAQGPAPEAAAPAEAPAPGEAAKALPAPVPAPAEAAGDQGARLMLQVGAYKTAEDADATRARLALLGLDAKVTQVQADGATLYRVRLGPYGQLDDLNGIRRTLSENGMEAQLVHAH